MCSGSLSCQSRAKLPPPDWITYEYLNSFPLILEIHVYLCFLSKQMSLLCFCDTFAVVVVSAGNSPCSFVRPRWLRVLMLTAEVFSYRFQSRLLLLLLVVTYPFLSTREDYSHDQTCAVYPLPAAQKQPEQQSLELPWATVCSYAQVMSLWKLLNRNQCHSITILRPGNRSDILFTWNFLSWIGVLNK